MAVYLYVSAVRCQPIGNTIATLYRLIVAKAETRLTEKAKAVHVKNVQKKSNWIAEDNIYFWRG